jgi:hypothetical protein
MLLGRRVDRSSTAVQQEIVDAVLDTTTTVVTQFPIIEIIS